MCQHFLPPFVKGGRGGFLSDAAGEIPLSPPLKRDKNFRDIPVPNSEFGNGDVPILKIMNYTQHRHNPRFLSFRTDVRNLKISPFGRNDRYLN